MRYSARVGKRGGGRCGCPMHKKAQGLALLLVLLITALLSMAVAVLSRTLLDERRLNTLVADSLQHFWWAEGLLREAEQAVLRMDRQQEGSSAPVGARFLMRHTQKQGCYRIEQLDGQAVLPHGQGHLYRISAGVPGRRLHHPTLVQSHFLVTGSSEPRAAQSEGLTGVRIAWYQPTTGIDIAQWDLPCLN